MTKLVGVDVGGTFTDVVAIDGDQIITAKVPTDVQSSDRSVLAGAERVGVGDASVFNLASTAGLNAVITRTTPKIAFLTTLGHRDILDRGRVGRPWHALTDAHWRRGFGDAADPLVPRYLRRGLHERVTASGEVLIPLAEEQVREQLQVLRRCDVQGVAICLLNAYVNPKHEQRVRDLVAEELGGVACSVSSEVSPLAKEYVRASTTVVDVVMKLMYREYTARLETGLGELGFEGAFNYADCRAMLMASDYAMERPYRLVVGGPAAGTVASAHFGQAMDDHQLLCADVGGTSCDISVVIDGQPWVNATFDLEYDLIVNALSTDIVTLGAGGGSIVSINATGELQVGPDSAGAEPGPACYGKSGTRPTVTDAALLIGVLAPDRFLGGQMPLDPALAERAFATLDTGLTLSQRVQYAWLMSLHNVAEGLLDISIRRGIDPREFSLVAYGAAGPMLLPGLLDLVPLRRVIVPPHPGHFSALGLLSADQVYSDHRSAYTVLTPGVAPAIDQLFHSMETALLDRVGSGRESVTVQRSFDGRLYGQSFETPFVEVPSGALTEESVGVMIQRFHDVYEQRNGNRFDTIPVQGVTYRVQVIVPSDKVAYTPLPATDAGPPPPDGAVTLRHLYGTDRVAAEYERAQLQPGHHLAGPAVVREDTSTTFVPAGRHATVGAFGELIIE